MPVIKNPHDDPEYVNLRKNQEDPLVMYLIVNSDLNMSIGKACAQTAHASQMITQQIHEWDKNDLSKQYEDRIKEFNKWCDQSYRKVVLRASKKEWEKIKEQLDCMVVIDIGLTEVFSGAETVLILFPMKKSEVPKIIKRLQIL